MKLTIYNVTPTELPRISKLISSYVDKGYVDEQRMTPYKSVIYVLQDEQTREVPNTAVAIWGDREHIRIRFEQKET